MEAMHGQVQAVVDELTLLKAEIIQLKSSHATMHQASVDGNTQAAARFAEQGTRVMDLEARM